MLFCVANKTNSNLSLNSTIKQVKHKHNDVRVNKLENMFSPHTQKKTQKHDTQFYYKYYSPFICIFI